MSRSERLFTLLHALRRLPSPVTAEQLAAELGVSVRSIYRDIESLRVSGADIAGERGYGYCLIEDGSLPPQKFTRMEIEALALGMAKVRHIGDPALTEAAISVLAKVTATLPSLSQQQLMHNMSLAHQFVERHPVTPDMQLIREACWHEAALQMHYADAHEAQTHRQIWPLAVVYVEQRLVLLAWCCLRKDFRMFRLDRIGRLEKSGTSFRPKRAALLRQYLQELNAHQNTTDSTEPNTSG